MYDNLRVVPPMKRKPCFETKLILIAEHSFRSYRLLSSAQQCGPKNKISVCYESVRKDQVEPSFAFVSVTHKSLVPLAASSMV
jgi:hypothetical protein